MDLDVRCLRILREVALRGTITAAAGALGFTPSAISQQLSALERESGTVLLERAGRRVRLTFAGQSLVEQAGTVLAALEEAQAALEVAREAVGGELRVAASGSAAQALVMPIAAELSADTRCCTSRWPSTIQTMACVSCGSAGSTSGGPTVRPRSA